MKKIKSLIKLYPWLVVIIIIIVAVGFFFFRNNNSSLEIMDVISRDFVQNISVSGTVQAVQDVDLGFAQNGRVSHTYAQVGDKISAGSLVAEIENGDLRANVVQKQAVFETEQAKLSVLQQGTRPEQIAITEAQINSDNISLEQAKKGIINAVQSAYTVSNDAVRNKIDLFLTNGRNNNPALVFVTSNSQLEGDFLTNRISIESMLTQWQKDVANISTGSDLSNIELETQNNLNQISKFLSDANTLLNISFPSTYNSKMITQSDISGWTNSIEIARTSIDSSLSSLTSVMTIQKNALANLEKNQKNLTLEKSGSIQSSIDAQVSQVESAKASLQNAEAQLSHSIIYAPFTGTITKMDAKVGQIITSNTSEISMISNGVFQIVSNIPEVYIADLKVGNTAKITLDAYGPDVIFSAKVIAINPAETVIGGVSTYKTTLQFDENDIRIKSGMTSSITITTQNIPNSIIIPKGAIVEKNGKTFVSVKQNKIITEREIKTGNLSSIGEVVVTSGLNSGDSIILNPIK